MSALEIRNIEKSFGPTEVLKGINIGIESGEFLVLVGPSGCGKSTLLNMIAGLDTVSGGEIAIGDKVVNDTPPSERDIAMVFQSYALYPNMTVEKNISFGLEMRKVPLHERQSKVASVAKMLQIVPLLKRKPSQLSGGQRQRVAMGRALVRDPKIFLFDEPLSNLDAKLRVDMRTEIKKLHKRVATTIVYVTHDQIEAMTLATKIAVMKGGIVQQLGTPEEVYNRPNNTFVASFMGSPSMNLIPVTLVKKDTGYAVEISLSGNKKIHLPVLSNPSYERYINKSVILGLRPEAITDPGSAEQGSQQLHERQCLIEVTEPTGADVFVHISLNNVEAVGRMRANCGSTAGESSSVVFNMQNACLFDADSGELIG